MIQNDAHSCALRRQDIGSRIDALWQREPELLRAATVELDTVLEYFVGGYMGVSPKDIPHDEVALLQAFLPELRGPETADGNGPN